MSLPVKPNRWQLAWMLLSLLWLGRVVVLAVDDYPAIAASGGATFDDIRDGSFVLYGVPAVATEPEVAALYERVLDDLASDAAAGRPAASAKNRSGTSGVDLDAHAADHPWLASQLSSWRERASRRATTRYLTTWIAVWVIPVAALALVGWGIAGSRRRLRGS